MGKQKGFIPYETCQPYLACSAESEEGFCPHGDTTCSPVNTCRTCSGFSDKGGQCVELNYFPNATIAEYGEIGTGFRSMLDTQASRVHKIKAEIFKRGPVACTVNANPLRDYEGGILDDDTASTSSNHIVSIIGFGKDDTTGKEYWIIRNSWGEYWGGNGICQDRHGEEHDWHRRSCGVGDPWLFHGAKFAALQRRWSDLWRGIAGHPQDEFRERDICGSLCGILRSQGGRE